MCPSGDGAINGGPGAGGDLQSRSRKLPLAASSEPGPAVGSPECPLAPSSGSKKSTVIKWVSGSLSNPLQHTHTHCNHSVSVLRSGSASSATQLGQHLYSWSVSPLHRISILLFFFKLVFIYCHAVWLLGSVPRHWTRAAAVKVLTPHH